MKIITKGLIKRRKLYNYTIAANDEYREVEIFVSLNRIFSCCNEFNRILKYIIFEIVFTRSGNNSLSVYGANNTAIYFGGNESKLTSISLQLLRVKLRADIASNLEKLYKRLFEVAYYKRICENAATQAGTQRTFSHVKTFTKSEEECCRYVFVIIKNHANDTNKTNYQRCCHANISNITVCYAGCTYPLLAYGADWNRFQYSRFYKEFINVSQNLGYSSPGLSMQKFRDLYTIFAIDVSAQTTNF